MVNYDAFISYRHKPLDMEIAKKIHGGLENYKIPKAVRTKTGKKKMGRVFRDQEELPIGSDLSDNITEAIKRSTYLIVICSPDTPGSEWVQKEIDSFIRIHDREHVLAVLVDGEPQDSFPEKLLKDEYGNPVEPLAADVRGKNKKERNTKLKTELLRLAAPIIGCTYDDLKQRHKERIIKKTIAVVSAAALVLSAAAISFGIYNASVANKMTKLYEEKTALNEELNVEYKANLENQSRFFAQESMSVFNTGDRENAVLIAMEGLPSEDKDRPYVPDAEYALSKALYAYDVRSEMGYDRTIRLDLTARDIFKSNDNKRMIFIDSAMKTYVYNAETYELICAIEPTYKDDGYIRNVVCATADSSGCYVTYEKEFIKYNDNGEVIYDKSFDDYIVTSVISPDDNIGFIVCHGSVMAFDLKSGDVVSLFFNDDEEFSFTSQAYYDAEKDILAVGKFLTKAEKTYISIIDVKDKTLKTTSVSEGYIMNMFITPNHNVAVMSCNSDFVSNGISAIYLDLVNTDTDTLWTKEVDADIRNVATFNSKMKAHSFPEGGSKVSEIVIAIEYEVFVYDEEKGELVNTINLPDQAVTLHVGIGSPSGYIGYMQGKIDIINFHQGRILSNYTIDTGERINDILMLKDMIAVRSYLSPDIKIMSYHEGKGVGLLNEFDNDQYFKTYSDSAKTLVTADLTNMNIRYFYDDSGKLLYRFADAQNLATSEGFLKDFDTYIFYTYDDIYFINPKEKKYDKTSLTSLGIEDSVTYSKISKNGAYTVLWSFRDMYVVDNEQKKLVYKKEFEEGSTDDALISNDGIKLLVLQTGRPLVMIDTKKDDLREFDKEFTAVPGSMEDNITISEDGSYIAMCCKDGNCRVYDISSDKNITAFNVQTKSRMFVSFAYGTKFLVIQGDDYIIRIWDLEEQKLKNSISASLLIDSLAEDPENSRFALSDGTGTYLIDEKSGGTITHGDNAVAYSASDDKFYLISDDLMKLYSVPYKDADELIKEAKDQFPEASLSYEEKVRFNIF